MITKFIIFLSLTTSVYSETTRPFPKLLKIYPDGVAKDLKKNTIYISPKDLPLFEIDFTTENEPKAYYALMGYKARVHGAGKFVLGGKDKKLYFYSLSDPHPQQAAVINNRSFYHSSFFGQRGVYMAGWIGFGIDGKLMGVTDGSGHYRPTAGYLDFFINWLRTKKNVQYPIYVANYNRIDNYGVLKRRPPGYQDYPEQIGQFSKFNPFPKSEVLKDYALFVLRERQKLWLCCETLDRGKTGVDPTVFRYKVFEYLDNYNIKIIKNLYRSPQEGIIIDHKTAGKIIHFFHATIDLNKTKIKSAFKFCDDPQISNTYRFKYIPGRTLGQEFGQGLYINSAFFQIGQELSIHESRCTNVYGNDADKNAIKKLRGVPMDILAIVNNTPSIILKPSKAAYDKLYKNGSPFYAGVSFVSPIKKGSVVDHYELFDNTVIENDFKALRYLERVGRTVLAFNSKKPSILHALVFQPGPNLQPREPMDMVGAGIKDIPMILEKMNLDAAINLDGAGSSQLFLFDNDLTKPSVNTNAGDCFPQVTDDFCQRRHRPNPYWIKIEEL